VSLEVGEVREQWEYQLAQVLLVQDPVEMEFNVFYQESLHSHRQELLTEPIIGVVGAVALVILILLFMETVDWVEEVEELLETAVLVLLVMEEDLH
jgi:Fe2+ transport system protein B